MVPAKSKLVLVLLLSLIAAINLWTMPRDLYPGDSTVLRSASMHLVRTGHYGFSTAESLKIALAAETAGQFFFTIPARTGISQSGAFSPSFC